MFDNTESSDPRFYNSAFVDKLSVEGPEKAAAALTSYIRTKVREESFARPILGSQPITQLELDVDEKTSTPVKYVDLEPDSQGYALTFRGKSPEKWFKGIRFANYFANYRSDEFRCTLGELATYRAPIKKIVHDNHLLDVLEREDKTFIDGLEDIISTTGKTYNSVVGFFAPELVKAAKLITNDRLKVGTILINESSFQDLLAWPASQVGDDLATEVHVNGWTYSKLLGYNFVRTNKTHLVPDGTIYLFAPPEYLGKHYVLHDAQTYFKQEGPEISFYVWEDVGMGIGNTNAVSKFTWTP